MALDLVIPGMAEEGFEDGQLKLLQVIQYKLTIKVWMRGLALLISFFCSHRPQLRYLEGKN